MISSFNLKNQYICRKVSCGLEGVPFNTDWNLLRVVCAPLKSVLSLCTTHSLPITLIALAVEAKFRYHRESIINVSISESVMTSIEA